MWTFSEALWHRLKGQAKLPLWQTAASTAILPTRAAYVRVDFFWGDEMGIALEATGNPFSL